MCKAVATSSGYHRESVLLIDWFEVITAVVVMLNSCMVVAVYLSLGRVCGVCAVDVCELRVRCVLWGEYWSTGVGVLLPVLQRLCACVFAELCVWLT